MARPPRTRPPTPENSTHGQAVIRGAVARAAAAVTAFFADAVHRVRNAAALRRRAQQNRERVERERRADAAARELLGDAAPLTGAPLAHLGLTPNNLVRSMVSEYRDASSRRA